MWIVLLLGVLLLMAVFVSERARTSVLSTSVMFLLVGLALGPTWLAWLHLGSSERLVGRTAELVLFTVLFVDGAHLSCGTIARAWQLPGRALLLGLPLTIGAIALAAHLVLDLAWLPSLLLGAILSPTDPAMVRTILEHEAVPERLRRLLSVESGLNDGLALPPIIVLLAILGVSNAHPWIAVLDALGGIAIGVAWGALVSVDRLRWVGIADTYRPMVGIAIAAAVYGTCALTGLNELLAAFAAGVTIATLREDLARDLTRVGEPVAETVKLAALLAFGATLALHLSVPTVAFAVLVLVAARPLALLLAFFRGGLPRAEWLAAAWFGPKGFASLLYAALVLGSGLPLGRHLYAIVGVVVTISIVAHSSTDSLVARAFSRRARGTADASS